MGVGLRDITLEEFDVSRHITLNRGDLPTFLLQIGA
jgi:hypothetical protein